jgi:hypothetical protein
MREAATLRAIRRRAEATLNAASAAFRLQPIALDPLSPAI